MAAACATKAEVLAFAPELTDSPTLDVIIEITCSMLSVEAWGEKLSLGHLLLAAHYATEITNSSAASGTVTARSIDKLSESYATAVATGAFASTKYGRLFDALRKSLATAASWYEPAQGWI